MEDNGIVTLLEKKLKLYIEPEIMEEKCANTHVFVSCWIPNSLLESQQSLGTLTAFLIGIPTKY